MNLKRALFFALAVALTMTALVAESGDLTVTVEYKGGEVNADHPIWVFLWTSTDFANSVPIGAVTLTVNASDAEFPALNSSAVYVTVCYDEKGGYNPQMVGAPPSGTPLGAYLDPGASAPSPITLKDDGPTKVKVTFDGSFRMP